MTKEEIINEINCLLSELDNGKDAVSYLTQNDVNWLNENIKALKQESRWIPVTERLPDKLTNVNIAFDDCPNEYDVAYLRTTVNETYRKNGAENEWVSWMSEATYADYEVSAWMTIQPYKAESEDEE